MTSALRTINYRCQGASGNGVVLRAPLAQGGMKSDSNNAPTVNLAGIRRAKWTEKSLFGGLRATLQARSSSWRRCRSLA